ncbi:MAG: FG-GAP repeat protein [Bacteroidota bacterium]
MKKLFVLTSVILLVINVNAQGVGIGTSTPDSSAILHLLSTEKGFLVPRMDSAQRSQIVSPAQGLLVYQVKTNPGFYYYSGNTWYKVGVDGNGNEWIKNTAGDIYTNRKVGVGNSNPAEALDIAGNIKTIGEIRPNGIGGEANQVLTATGSGSMIWAKASATDESTGSGTWGDCSVNNITAFQPVASEDGAPNDNFGRTVAISGDYAIVGSASDDEADLTNNGSASIFKRNTATGLWELQVKLANPNPASEDFFGSSVAISGDYVIVGAHRDDEGAGLSDNGSATIFKRNSITGIWVSQGKLVNPNAASSDFFGNSVSISGDYAIVGAYWDSEGAGLSLNGSATVFKRNSVSGVWESQGKLVHPVAATQDYFGCSVSISGDYAIVGAEVDDYMGSAIIFKRNSVSGVWEFQAKLLNPNAASDEVFGRTVSISGNYAIVGALGDSEGAGLSSNGSATIFKRNAISGLWQPQVKLVDFTASSDDFFGWYVSISGDYAIVGAPLDDEGTGLTNNGSTSIFKRVGSVWQLVQKFTAPQVNAHSNDQFGGGICIDGATGRFLIGSQYLQSATGMAFFGKVK